MTFDWYNNESWRRKKETQNLDAKCLIKRSISCPIYDDDGDDMMEMLLIVACMNVYTKGL